MHCLSTETTPSRLDLLDAARGLAVTLMLVFHFCFDLNEFGYIHIDQLGNPFWLNFRLFIVSLFIGVSGISLVIATQRGIRWQKFLRREAILLACVALVSIGSFVEFPDSWIFFGILHFIAVASVMALPFVRFGLPSLVLGVGILLLSQWGKHPFFDQPALQWLGLMTHNPVTKDYVPLVPWFGVMLIGIFIGNYIQHWKLFRVDLRSRVWTMPLLWLGKHSLLVYIIHQPILFALFLVLPR